jgi:hypothetical protein
MSSDDVVDVAGRMPEPSRVRSSVCWVRAAAIDPRARARLPTRRTTGAVLVRLVQPSSSPSLAAHHAQKASSWPSCRGGACERRPSSYCGVGRPAAGRSAAGPAAGRARAGLLTAASRQSPSKSAISSVFPARPSPTTTLPTHLHALSRIAKMTDQPLEKLNVLMAGTGVRRARLRRMAPSLSARR